MIVRPPRCFGYVRASTTEQQSTLETQRERLEMEYKLRFKDKYAWAGCFVDSGVSGSVPLWERPMGSKLNTALDRGDLLIVSKLDRGFRSLMDLCMVMKQLEQRGVGLVLCDIGLDLTQPVGRMVAHILGAVAEFERERIRQRIMEGFAKKRATGWIPGQPPYGFKFVDKKQMKLVYDPETRAKGVMMLEWYKAGCTFEQIMLECWKRRIYTRQGKRMSPKVVSNFVRGEYRLQRKEQGNGQAKDNQQVGGAAADGLPGPVGP